MAGLVVVCGLDSEARILRGEDGAIVVVGGGNADRISCELDRLAPSHVLSCGIAGGLDPTLKAGAARIASAVVMPDGSHLPTDPVWSAALAERLAVGLALVAGVDKTIAAAAAKSALRRTTGADLVDMETHTVALWAARHAVPATALRVVTDSARHTLPHAATVGMRPDGSIAIGAVARSIAMRPGQIPALVRTGLEARRALASLLRCRKLLGPAFALGDLV